MSVAWERAHRGKERVSDKVLGHVLLAESLNNGRLVGHTLLFGIAVFALGWAIRGTDVVRSRNVMALGIADIDHLQLDQMWLFPETLLWPAFGIGFPAEDFHYLDWITTLLTDPVVYIGEATGGILLIAITGRYGLFRPSRLWSFLGSGRLIRE